MTCRHCGTEIAEKAIVCYRCGTATSEPRRQPSQASGRRRLPLIPAAVALALGGLAALYLAPPAEGALRNAAYVLLTAAAALVIAAVMRKRR
jgi:hypothetical protein